MKNPPIYYMGTQVNKPRARNGRYTFKSQIAYQWTLFKAWTWKWTKRAAFAMVFVAILFAVYLIGQANVKETTAINVLPQQIAPAKIAPVMERIFKAESGNQQYGSSGQVLIHINTNNTVDIGAAQINSVWFTLATKLGYDLTKEKDNKAFAIYLYQNYGTGPWESSSARWKQ